MLKIEAKSSVRDARQVIVRIQKVIWDHLLAFKGEIIHKQALFSLPFRTPNINSRVASCDLTGTLNVDFLFHFEKP